MNLVELTAALRQVEESSPNRIWSEETLELLRLATAWEAAVPEEYGGRALNRTERCVLYEAVSCGSMSAALILTQHDGAVELLNSASEAGLAKELLPRCATGELLLTVGISQLTTARQGGKPALVAIETKNGFELDGVMPWVTSAPHADYIVTGAVTEDGQQILAAVPSSANGLKRKNPKPLLALNPTATCEIGCLGVFISRDQLLKGPCEYALERRSTVKSLTVSSCGIGLARSLVEAIEAGSNPLSVTDLAPVLRSYHEIRDQFDSLTNTDDELQIEQLAVPLRAEINNLLGRLALTLMVEIKGSGYYSNHPLQRLIREALFFLVWSAPQDVRKKSVEHIWGTEVSHTTK